MSLSQVVAEYMTEHNGLKTKGRHQEKLLVSEEKEEDSNDRSLLFMSYIPLFIILMDGCYTLFNAFDTCIVVSNGCSTSIQKGKN